MLSCVDGFNGSNGIDELNGVAATAHAPHHLTHLPHSTHFSHIPSNFSLSLRVEVLVEGCGAGGAYYSGELREGGLFDFAHTFEVLE